MKFIKLKNLKKLGIYIVLPLFLLATGGVGGTVFMVDFTKDAYQNSNWYNEEDGGINETKYISLGGFDQFVRIRGRDLNNPVLLDLHGGPGSTLTGISHRFFRPMTEYFTLVEWDQRGAGKSAGNPAELYPTMTYDQMVNDTIELIEYIKIRLGVEKVVILGHSWGTMLGLGVIKKRPDLIHAYVGSGQGMAWRPTVNESQRLLTEAYIKLGDEEAIAALKAIPEQWPPTEDWQATWDRVISVQRHLGKLKKGLLHAVHNGQAMGNDFFLDNLYSPDTSLMETFAQFRGEDINGATSALRAQLQHWSLLDNPDYYNYDVPMFIFQGEHDWQTPTTLVKTWFAKVAAPHKEYVAFEHSAHAIITEEPGKYLYTLVNRVRPFALKETK